MTETTRSTRLMALLLTLAAVALAQPLAQPSTQYRMVDPPKRFSRDTALLNTSYAAMVGANVADAVTSHGKYEANPILRGADGRYDSTRGTLLKAAVIGGLIGTQYLITRKRPEWKRTLAWANFAIAGGLSAVAVHNAGIPRP